MDAGVVEIVDLHKRYGDTAALDRVNFQVSAGELFGLLGPNGAGKTTLLSIISGLLLPTSGEVHVLGRKVQESERDLRRHIGLVPQELALYGELTGRENLHFFGQLYGLGGPELRQRVEEVLHAVGLHDRAGRRVDTYSGGMKRRLNLGAGLVHQPRVLLLDEPTAGVDPQSRNYLFEEIRRVNAAGTTVIYSSHYMEEAQALCSRIGIIDHGRLIACDSVPALLRRLPGLIRFRVPDFPPALRDRLKQVPGIQLTERPDQIIELESQDLKGTLLQLVAALNDLDIELTSLEIEEPTLERVFLSLTGRELRD
jgi:ABC-2 type transport system ATP-binding protein